MFKLMKKDKGFSLVELLVVVIIMAILATIAVPIYLRYVEKGKAAGPKAYLRSVKEAYETRLTTTGSTDGYEVEDALDDAGIKQAVREEWEFDVLGNPPTEYVCTSTAEFESGEGKQVRFIVEDNEYTGWGIDTFTNTETGGEE